MVQDPYANPDEPVSLDTILAMSTEAKKRLKLKPWKWILSGQVSLDENGQLRIAHDTSGDRYTVDLYTSSIYAKQQIIKNQTTPITVGDGFDDETESWRGEHKIKAVPYTLDGAGGLADLALLAGVASYKGRMRILGVVDDTGAAPLNMDFQDEDNGALVGNIVGGYNVTLTAQVFNTTLAEGVLYCNTANKALEVDLSGGGALANGVIIVETWYDPS